MTIPTTQETKSIHDYYCALTGLSIPYTMQIHYIWEQWFSHGFVRGDLPLVVRYIRHRIKEGRRERESLLLRNCIARTDVFAEDLAMVRSRRVPQSDPNLDSVLLSTGRTPPNHDKHIRTPSEILAGLEAFKQFQAMKEAL